jgi:hypothetical protein
MFDGLYRVVYGEPAPLVRDHERTTVP